MNKKLIGFNVGMIIGIIFTIIGAVFMVVGIAAMIAPGDISMLFTYIFGGIGLLFFIIGLPFLIFGIKKRKLKLLLIETGSQAVGIITDIEIDRTVRVNNRYQRKAHCKVVDEYTGEIYLYSSDGVAGNIDYLVGRQVTVYYDPDDRSKYYVDIESAERDYGVSAPEVHDFR